LLVKVQNIFLVGKKNLFIFSNKKASGTRTAPDARGPMGGTL
jgi:hypothetical protein